MRHQAHERPLASSLLLLFSLLLLPTPAGAQQTIDTLILLRPHCEQKEDIADPSPALGDFVVHGTAHCPNYGIMDPKTQQTPALKAGDTLDMDLILYNASRQKIRQIRTWITYDSLVLDGTSVSIAPEFPSVTPGEADFNPSLGYVQIGASADEGKEPSKGLIVLARIQFQVKAAPAGGHAPLTFYDLQNTLQGHTFITSAATPEKNLLPPELGSLMVTVPEGTATPATPPPAAIPDTTPPPAGTTGAAASASSVSSASTESSSQQRTAFVLLQVQNVRVGTEGSSLYLAWDPLRSSELAGYNVYYGTEKGRYIQRHSVATDTHSLALRGFVPGTLYYLAVRGVNKANEESAFSQEVAIKVGEPASSTAPLALTPGQNGPTENPVKNRPVVPGASGSSSWIALFVIGCACVGTMLAFRRQLASAPQPSRQRRVTLSPSPAGDIILS